MLPSNFAFIIPALADGNYYLEVATQYGGNSKQLLKDVRRSWFPLGRIWDNFRFYLTLDEAYDQSVPVVTTYDGKTITPRTSDGAYVLNYVRSDLSVTISGIVKNPPASTSSASTMGRWRR